MLHQGIPEVPAMPQALQHNVEEAVVFPGQVAQPWRQAVVVGAGLMLHGLAASFCNRVCSVLLLLQAGLPPAHAVKLPLLNGTSTQQSYPEHANSGGAETQTTDQVDKRTRFRASRASEPILLLKIQPHLWMLREQQCSGSALADTTNGSLQHTRKVSCHGLPLSPAPHRGRTMQGIT